MFSSKGRHKLNVTPLIATFQKCIVLQHQKDFEKSTKAIHRLFDADVPDETKTFKEFKKSGDWGVVEYALIQEPIDYKIYEYHFHFHCIYEYQFH